MKNFCFIELFDGSCQKGSRLIGERARRTHYEENHRQNVGAALIVTGPWS
jgi:hypothetical protein